MDGTSLSSVTDPISISRKMLAEDARWIADALLSASRTRQSGILPLLLLGHSARIVYEGSTLIRSATLGVGRPSLARRLPAEHADVIEKARHATKLFDDSARPYQVLLGEMDEYLRRARSEFLGHAHFKWARRFEADLGTFHREGRVLAITPTVAYRMGEPPATSTAALARNARSVSMAEGQALAILAEAAGQPFTAAATLPYTGIGDLSHRDRRSSKYLLTRYEPTYPESLKLVLLHVEGDLNTTSLILPETASGHDDAAFRARVITTYHVVSALAQADAANPQTRSPHLSRLQALLASPERQRLYSAHGRQVRNRCMHYEIRGALATASLDPTKPMNGIVETLPNGRSFIDYRKDVDVVLEEATRLMNDWKTR